MMSAAVVLCNVQYLVNSWFITGLFWFAKPAGPNISDNEKLHSDIMYHI